MAATTTTTTTTNNNPSVPLQGPPPSYGYAPQNYNPPPYAPIPQNNHTMVAVVQGIGNCPACRNGYMQEEFTVIGIILAVLFFPWGLLCCIMMKERRCSHCGYTY